MHQSSLRFVAVGLLVVASACEVIDRGDAGETAADPATGGVALALEAPGVVRPGEEAVVRLSLVNRADTTVRGVGAELIVPGWMEPVAPEPTGTPVTMVASPEGGIRLTFRMGDTPLQPGDTRTVTQRIRIPPVRPAEGAAPWSRVVRARLVDADGEPLGAEVESEVTMDTTGGAYTESAAGGGAADGSVIVEREGVGAVRLGMTADELMRTAPGARDTSWQQEGTTEHGRIVSLPDGGSVVALIAGDSVSRVLIRDREVRTAEGLGIGSRLEELRTAYGPACANVGEGTVVVWFAEAPGLSFSLSAEPSENWDQIRDDPELVPDTATVTGMWVRRGVNDCPTGS